MIKKHMTLILVVLFLFIGLVTEVSAKPAWQQEWEQLVKDAQTEGRLVLYSSTGGELRVALVETLDSKYGIKLDCVAGGSRGLVNRIAGQRNAGLFSVDVLLSGTGGILSTLKPMGALDQLEPVIILPEVKDPNNWFGGKFPWMDPKERTTVACITCPEGFITVNKNLVNPGEVKSYQDLLNPKWKGRIVITYPLKSGAMTGWVGAVEPIMGRDYLYMFAKQEPVVVENERLHVEWIARGKYPLGVAARYEVVAELKRAGAPLENIMPAEGIQLGAGPGQLRLMNKAPHPNAAKFFINWFLSKEGQTIYSKAAGQQSAREDVPVEHLDPTFIRQSGAKYRMANTEEWARKSEERQALSVKIFGHLAK
ncbi:MAG: extracellular solute-binding protein [Deltaproteobacteria bacterium]|nr:MAG: extracellular solute-binding protein [Deltaproteobacteria bacterium]